MIVCHKLRCGGLGRSPKRSLRNPPIFIDDITTAVKNTLTLVKKGFSEPKRKMKSFPCHKRECPPPPAPPWQASVRPWCTPRAKRRTRVRSQLRRNRRAFAGHERRRCAPHVAACKRGNSSAVVFTSSEIRRKCRASSAALPVVILVCA